MNELRNLVREGPIAEFLGRSHDTFQQMDSGLCLRIDEYWLAWWNSTRALSYGSPHFSIPSPRAARQHYQLRYNFTWHPDDWDWHCKHLGYPQGSHPVQVIVLLRRPISRDGLPDDWPRQIGPHAVVYEFRPEAELQASPSDQMTGMTMGTLGGMLFNKSDMQHYGVSCDHVVGSGNVSTSAGPLGKHVEGHFPPGHSGPCNRCVTSAPLSYSVDAAVFDLSGGQTFQVANPHLGKVAAVAPIAAIGQGDPVRLAGAASGVLSGRIKECCVWKDFQFRGQKFCFGDLLVIEDAAHQYISKLFTKPGDSGAWVLCNAAGHNAWDGMLIGGDGQVSYCSYAENIMALLDPNLSLAP